MRRSSRNGSRSRAGAGAGTNDSRPSSGTHGDGNSNSNGNGTGTGTDDIPHFANFSGTNIVLTPTKSEKKGFFTGGSRRNGRQSSRADVDELDEIVMNRNGIGNGNGNGNGGSYDYDAEAAESYKWAKHEATNVSTIDTGTDAHTGNGSNLNPVQKPSGGFLRSISASRNNNNNSRQQNHHRNSSRTGSAHRTPVKHNKSGAGAERASANGIGAPRIPGYQLKTRSRSASPSPSPKGRKQEHRYGSAGAGTGTGSRRSNKPIIASSRKMNSAPKKRLTEKEERLKQNYASKKYTFQTPAELVTYRTIDLNSRVAFEKKKLVTLSELHEVAKSMRPSGAAEKNNDSTSSSSSSSDLTNRLKRLSPSPQHLEILEAMGNISSTRQLCWSPSVSHEADPFHGWGDSDEDDAINLDTTGRSTRSSSGADRARRRQLLLAKKRRDIASKRVGRYRQLDLVKYVNDALPDHAPQLTNVKRRLPIRSDVGFPGATNEEIMMKQSEIAKEAQLEEISPRLVVLLSGEDVGSPPTATIDNLMDPKCLEHLETRLPGIPFATKALVEIKQSASKSLVRIIGHGQNKKKQKVAQPDRNSIFSPPVGSTSSSTDIWRPRPFADRAAALKQSLAIPLGVKFDCGNIEPLVCTLSMYCLPRGQPFKKGHLYGKISEDFLFPAGDWKDLLQEKAGQILAKQFGMESSSESKGRMKKAMFSFDPMALPTMGGRDGKESLYLYMEVHKVAHQDASEAYIDHLKEVGKGVSSKRNSIGGLFFGSGGKSSTPVHQKFTADAKERSQKVFDTFGIQLLTPICFGLLPIFPHESSENENEGLWPNGITQTMQLFSQPDTTNESDQAFIERLGAMADFIGEHPVVDDDIELSMSRADTDSIDTNESNDSGSILRILSKESTHKSGKRPFRRKGKNNKLPSTRDDVQGSIDASKLCGSRFIAGGAKFYISSMGADFSQALLQSPTYLNIEFNGRSSNAPRLFVDISGDCAIMVNPDQQTSTKQKRSNLIRLPPSTIPSGYADSSEIREILYLPQNADTHFDNTLPPTFRTPLNLLFLYPRFIKNVDDDGRLATSTKELHSNILRIRVVQQALKVDEKTYAAVAIYNPVFTIHNQTPFGRPIVQAAYTKIPLAVTSKKKISSIHSGIHLRDEIKVRLPDVLDGSYFIQFTLYSIDMNSDENVHNGGIKQTLIAETMIPLSSSSTQESIYGTKVSTVIPNGLHRIKLSSFQLDIQSRLISHTHISDPAVATIMRDFSEVRDANDDFSKFLPHSKVLSKATHEAIINHFRPLLFMHVRNFFTRGKLVFCCMSRRSPPSKHTLVMVDTMKSLLELMKRIQKLSKSGEKVIQHQIKRLVKDIIDDYDDFHFDKLHGNKKGIRPPSARLIISESEISSESKDGEEPLNESFDSNGDVPDRVPQDVVMKGPILSRRSHSKEQRLQELYESLNNSAPITRKAFGVSKIDRMKAEAELYETGQTFTELADDDETVITAATFQSQVRMASTMNSVAPSSKEPHDLASVRKIDLKSIVGNETVTGSKPHLPNSADTTLERAKEMARRVNTVAKVFISPCVAPEFDAGSENPVRKQLSSTKKLRLLQEKDPRVQKLRSQIMPQLSQKHLIYAGSDDEDCKSARTSDGRDNSMMLPVSAGRSLPLRGLKDHYKIRWTLSSEPGAENNRSPPFVYEIIFALWLHSMTTSVNGDRSAPQSNEKTVRLDPQSFMTNLTFLLPLCLKSLVVRCKDKNSQLELISSTALDMQHMQILEPLVERIASDLIHKVDSIDESLSDQVLSNVLSSSDALIDFFIGLLAVIHPSQPSWLISNYLVILADFEHNGLQDYAYLNRIRSCRQLRLRVIERLAALPRFIALNYPYKYQEYNQTQNKRGLSWIEQTPGITSNQSTSGYQAMISPVRDEFSPHRHWLAELLLNECFAICSQSCEAIVNKSLHRLNHGNSSKDANAKQSVFRRRLQLSPKEISYHESIAYHSITIAYDLILRRHATDDRFQSKEGTSRVAGMFLSSVVHNSHTAVQWLSKLNPTHKVRQLWLLSVMYVLQEAPEVIIRKQFFSMCDGQMMSSESQLVRFIKVMKLCTTSFQAFTDPQFSSRMSAWLMQESFNTISACAIVLVDECFEILSSKPFERQRMTEGVLQLLLSIIAVPLSSVTQLRALGSVSQVLEKAGAACFLQAVGNNLQHWGRMLFALMNSKSLSVRSMSVDLIISLFGSVYKEGGCIAEVAQVFVTILPETVAREIALHSANGLIHTNGCVEKCMWPLRRALADVEDANPVDDDRVETTLLPFLRQFCRICQAIIDGVIVEIRLQGENCRIVDTHIKILSGNVRPYHENGVPLPTSWMFDADEESVFEAANFFSPETSPAQKIRWLMTLKRLHESKGQWVEAAETLILCARTVADAIPHIKNVWRPSKFAPWNSGKEAERVMIFANEYLEPFSLRNILESSSPKSDNSRPTIISFAKILTLVSKEAVSLYDKEKSMVSLAYSRLQDLLKIVMDTVEDHIFQSSGGQSRRWAKHQKQNTTEEIAALRKASASINELLTKLAERMHLIAGEDNSIWSAFSNQKKSSSAIETGATYVRVTLFGKKLRRFQESTTIPTFLDWGGAHICRVPDVAMSKALRNVGSNAKNQMVEVEREISKAFAEPLLLALREEASDEKITFVNGLPDESFCKTTDSEEAFLAVGVVHSRSSTDDVQAKRFHGRKGSTSNQFSPTHIVTEIQVAKPFPCPLSRQPTLVTTEFLSAGDFFA